jgi:hypothetical protein
MDYPDWVTDMADEEMAVVMGPARPSSMRAEWSAAQVAALKKKARM